MTSKSRVILSALNVEPQIMLQVRSAMNSVDQFNSASGTIPTFISGSYLVPGVDATDIESTLEKPLSPTLVTPEQGAVFVFLPERLAELESVLLTFPGEIPGSAADEFAVSFPV